MKINNNIPAMQTQASLNKVNKAQSYSIQKLSSGLKINNLKDDATGMTMSKRMRAQIDSLKSSNRNNLEGISLIQTAEGALNEVHDVMRRMRELAVMSATDTYTEADREKMQVEIDELIKEIENISTTTQYNDINVLSGQYEIPENTGFELSKTSEGELAQYTISISDPSHGSTVTIDGVRIVFYDSSIAGYTPGSREIDINGDWETEISNLDFTNYTGEMTDLGLVLTAKEPGSALNSVDPITTTSSDITANSTMVTPGIDADDTAEYELKLGEITVGEGFTIDGVAFEYYDSTEGEYRGTAEPIDINQDAEDIISYLTKYNFKNVEVEPSVTGYYDLKITSKAEGDNYLIIHNGATAPRNVFIQSGAEANQLTQIDLSSVTTEGLGLTSRMSQNGYTDYLLIEDNIEDDGINTARYGISILTMDDANNAIGILDEAISKVSAQRGYMGAMQNRLEYAAKNTGNAEVNSTGALSRIIDTNMAEEMAEFTKNNIVIQSSSSMLAQANQRPQEILKLLK
ncbi:MAG: hypothetical protein BEN19_06975 [Epulopiscium sp. Nuni2H_MBin003]|nr:MAG: hypothetical protein BEN19_06975 [Epulopiscium sp. Nuni2H_MBin003]